MGVIRLIGQPRERERFNVVTRQAYVGPPLTGSINTKTYEEFEFTSDVTHSSQVKLLRKQREMYKHQSSLRKTFMDIGGPFLNVKGTYRDENVNYDSYTLHTVDKTRRTQSVTGCHMPFTASATRFTNGAWFPALSASDYIILDAYGTTAISRTSPTNPHAEVLTMVGELYRDGLPTAMGIKSLRDRDLAAEFLNFEFGIKPLVSDIRKLHRSLTESKKILDQYYRDSGKLVRRRYEFPEQIDTTLEVTPGVYPTPTGATAIYGGDTGLRRKRTTTRSRVWFSGAFTYYAHRPTKSVQGIWDQIQEYNHLLGLMPSASAIWNLLPWSWAIDWVTNMGDIMNNLTMFSNDGLVLAYGYVMEHKIRDIEYNLSEIRCLPDNWINSTQRFRTEVKCRRRATPFGFGLEQGSFTPRQWAILAALGFSRSQSIAR